MTDLAILDLGYGNTRSIALAFERLGHRPLLTDDPAVAMTAGRLVLPGVGAAGPAMARLKQTGLDQILRRRIRPTLGICLGMQLLFEQSEESSEAMLALLPGTVARLRPGPGFPVPHMGWSRVEMNASAAVGLGEGDYLYFAHSFRCPPCDFTIAEVTYGSATIPAALRRGNLWGAQFHPERSSQAGSRFLQAFAAS